MANYSKQESPKGQDKLVDISGNKVSPYQAKPSDWPNVQNPVGETKGVADKLFNMSVTQEGPRHCEDDGPGKGAGTPVPKDRSRVIAANFPVGQSHANEGVKPSTAWKCSVNLETGQMEPEAYEQKY
jgi:hypothetical protein